MTTTDPKIAATKPVGTGDLLGPNVLVRTHLGETGKVLGKLWTGQYEVEIDNSEDKRLVKRWLGNIREIYSPHELTPLCPNTLLGGTAEHEKKL